MMRVILTPAVLPPDALAELKAWLGVTTTTDDAELTDLLTVALGVCADFTGLMPLAVGAEEMLPLPPPPPRPLPSPLDWCDVTGAWGPTSGLPSYAAAQGLLDGYQALATRPVTAVTGIEGVDVNGVRTAFAPSAYQVVITADGTARIAVTQPGNFTRCAVQFTAGYSASWDSLPDPIRHGIIRLAAHQYRNIDNAGAVPLPPAAVTALWLPWRRLNLA